jgi:hypothetical protein
MRSNTRWITWTCGLLLAGGLGVYPLSTQSAKAEDRELNPQIHHALDALHDAHKEIDEARHDFHGRKHEALDVLDKAISELEAIKDYDH